MKYILLIILTISGSLCAQKFSVSGIVTDAETNKPLSGVTIRLNKTNFGTYSDTKGRFQINGIPAGQYTLSASMIGYKTYKEALEINSDIDLSVKLQEKAISTSEIIVSANKRVQAVQEVPISVSVIESADLLNRSTSRLDEALRYVPGVEVNQDNVSIRGSSGFSFGIGSRALLLVDGFPLLSGDNGDIEMDAIPLFNIERIEIVKGAGSALYGTSALGGVINIITKKPKPEPKLDLRILSGFYTEPKYDGWKLSSSTTFRNKYDLNYSQKFGRFGLNIGGSAVNDQSYREYDDEDIYSFTTKFDYKISDYTKIDINTDIMLKNRADWVYWNSLDSATKPPSNTNRDIRIKTESYSVYGKLNHIFNKDHFLVLKTGILSSNFNNTFDENNPEYRQSEANNANIELQMNSNLTNALLLTYGLNYANNQVNSATYGDHSQEIFSAYSQIEFNRNILTLNGGLRFDLESADTLDKSLQISPKAGMTLKLSEDLNLRASAGAGFRAPSVAERFASVAFQGFDVIPNADLKPERSISFEAGGTYESIVGGLPLSLDLSIFDNEMYDLIEPSFIEGTATIQFQNLTRARILGTEISLRTILPADIGLETSVTYMDPRDIELDKQLKYRSELLWTSSLLIPYKFMSLKIDYRYKSKVKNIDTRLGVQIEDHDARVPVKVLDANLTADLEQIFSVPLKISLTGKNLLDYYYTEVPGNLAATRFLGIQAEYHGF